MSPDVAAMRRGMGGRIEESFAAAKEAGRAAFVTFVTAGYPRSEGAFLGLDVWGWRTERTKIRGICARMGQFVGRYAVNCITWAHFRFVGDSSTYIMRWRWLLLQNMSFCFSRALRQIHM